MNTTSSHGLHTTSLPGLHLWRRGKVRDVYDLDPYLLIVTTDRISAYDVVMNQPIPDKGKILTELSSWWFDQLSSILPNHLVATDVDDFPNECRQYRDQLEGRSMLVKKTTPYPVECVARGYLAGSGWREYNENGTVCGLPLPEGLRRGDKLPETIFTPATKAEEGHDENISFTETESIIGSATAERLKELTISIYNKGAEIALSKGIIIADTKFEFGYDESGTIILIDEVLTPDSSRFWLASSYKPGSEPVNFDKQYLRDWLDSTDWDRTPPPPDLPEEVTHKTAELYRKAVDMLTENESIETQ